MNTELFWLILVITGLISLFIFGFFDICLNALLRFLHHRHQRLRWAQRPSRIFLIRHGESQANLDTSKHIFHPSKNKMTDCFSYIFFFRE